MIDQCNKVETVKYLANKVTNIRTHCKRDSVVTSRNRRSGCQEVHCTSIYTTRQVHMLLLEHPLCIC